MTIHERLRSARRDAGYASAVAAAREFGRPVGTYSCHENGSRGIKLDVVERYARAFDVDPLWLFHGNIDASLSERANKQFMEFIQRTVPELKKLRAATTPQDQIRLAIEEGIISRFNIWGESVEAVTQQVFGSGTDAPAPSEEYADSPADTVRAKVVALAAVVGSGADSASEEVIGSVWFNREWLKGRGIDAVDCAVLGLQGRPNWPTLPDGYALLVDRSRTEGIPGEDFVFRAQDGLVVKSIIAPADDEGWLLKEALTSEPEPYPDDSDVVGLIVWAGRMTVETEK